MLLSFDLAIVKVFVYRYLSILNSLSDSDAPLPSGGGRRACVSDCELWALFLCRGVCDRAQGGVRGGEEGGGEDLPSHWLWEGPQTDVRS